MARGILLLLQVFSWSLTFGQPGMPKEGLNPEELVIRELNDSAYFLAGSDNNTALRLADSAIIINNKKYPSALAFSHYVKGLVYKMQGMYEEAANNYTSGIRIYNSTGEEIPAAHLTSALGSVLVTMGRAEEGLTYHQEALQVYLKTNQRASAGSAYSNIATAWLQLGRGDSAVIYLRHALQTATAYKDAYFEGIVRYNLAEAFQRQGQTDSAFYHAERALHLQDSIADHDGLADTHRALGRLYFKKNNAAQSRIHFTKALSYADSMNARDAMQQIYKDLSEVSEKLGDYQNGLYYFKNYHAFRDSLNSVEVSRNLDDIRSKYESDKKEQQLLVQEAQLKEEKIYRYFIGSVVLLLFIGSGLLFERYRVTRKQKKIIENQKAEVEEKNREVTDSIRYASRIQQAILPPTKLIQQILPDSFLLYLPRDIVAGDFYWVEQSGDYTFVAVADCTGHGVPGAMVSVMCSNALSKCVHELNINDPALILDQASALLEKRFSRSEEELRDGMDICLIRFSKNSQELLYAGANAPLWIISKGAVKEIKPDKQPVGRFEYRKPFYTIELPLEKDDMIYLFSDGFADQFGGPKGKKLKLSGLRSLLLEIHSLPADQQEKHLHAAFMQWKGSLGQVDDVCVMGIRPFSHG